MENKAIEIPEHKISVENISLDIKQIDYLESFFKGGKTPHLFRDIHDPRKIKIQNTSYAGVIHLVGKPKYTRIQFIPKVNTNLFYMLRYLHPSGVEEKIIYDLKRLIPIEAGLNFYDIIGRLFESRLDIILKKGLLRRYIRKNDNCRFIKGKILFSKNILKNPVDHSKTFCRYNELTQDNTENRILLYALGILTGKIKDKRLKLNLKKNEIILSRYVTYQEIDNSMFNRLSFDRINSYYKEILNLSEFIIKRRYINSLTSDNTSVGFNFIVDMNYVYEDFLSALIQEYMRNEYGDKYTVDLQQSIRKLDLRGELRLKPDIMITHNKTKKRIIIDAKYKPDTHNSDYYQVLSYLLSYGKLAHCGILLYPDNEKLGGGKELLFSNNLAADSPEYNIPIYTETINLGYKSEPENSKDFDKFKQQMIHQIHDILRHRLNELE